MILFILQVVFLMLWLTVPTFAAIPLWIVFAPILLAIFIAVCLCVVTIVALVMAAYYNPLKGD